MKSTMIQLLVAGATPFLPWHLAGLVFTLGTLSAPVSSLASSDDPGEKVIRVNAVVKSVEPGEGEGEVVVTAQADDGATPMVWVTKENVGENDGRSTFRLARVGPKVSGDPAERAWLGVSIDEVPEALAAQLNTDGRGVLISNVVTGSPADKAGFQAHDVILSVNGEAVDGESVRAVDLIQARKPGDTASFVVLRNGEETTLTATLGSWADSKADATGFAWKFETAPDAEIKDHIKTRGKFIHRGPAGEWTVKDLGDLKGMDDLPHNIKVFVPKSGDRSTDVFVANGKRTIKMQVNNNGASFTVERTDDGPITVRRTDADGNETVGSYDDEESLREGDEEAFKVFTESGKGIVINVDGSTTVDGGFDFDFDFDVDGWEDAMSEWRTHMEGGIAEANEAYAKAMEEVHAALQKLKDEGGQGAVKLGQLHMLMHPDGDHAELPMIMGLAQMAKPRQSFEARPDGTIEVRVRKGDSELVQLYRNEFDLQQRDADLYAKYQELKSIKE